MQLSNGQKLNFIIFKTTLLNGPLKTCHIIQTIIITQKQETEIVLISLQTV